MLFKKINVTKLFFKKNSVETLKKFQCVDFSLCLILFNRSICVSSQTMNQGQHLWDLSANHEPLIQHDDMTLCKSWDAYVKIHSGEIIVEWKWLEHDQWALNNEWETDLPDEDQDVLLIVHPIHSVEVYVRKSDESVIKAHLQRFSPIIPSLHSTLSFNACMSICESVKRVIAQMTLVGIVMDYMIECRVALHE